MRDKTFFKTEKLDLDYYTYSTEYSSLSIAKVDSSFGEFNSRIYLIRV